MHLHSDIRTLACTHKRTGARQIGFYPKKIPSTTWNLKHFWRFRAGPVNLNSHLAESAATNTTCKRGKSCNFPESKFDEPHSGEQLSEQTKYHCAHDLIPRATNPSLHPHPYASRPPHVSSPICVSIWTSRSASPAACKTTEWVSGSLRGWEPQTEYPHNVTRRTMWGGVTLLPQGKHKCAGISKTIDEIFGMVRVCAGWFTRICSPQKKNILKD